MTSVVSFVYGVLGKRLTAPGGLGGQCVDAANAWLVHVGIPEVFQNAADWATVAYPHLKWEANGPVNFPAPGSLVVWRAYGGHGIGPYGHIAVCVAADAHALVTLDQNWPEGSPCALVAHDYIGVAGWQALST